ncbi:cora-domain-containing protein [Phaffia rhodozyma]|uniref:Magnesium transporter n=1 Tax=Phaffia rhodozyma TaxID=264483 RepID=A0A0F7SN36_PHARH|nr:cora-domain-containing protein [Phaffia rhodozyma]
MSTREDAMSGLKAKPVSNRPAERLLQAFSTATPTTFSCPGLSFELSPNLPSQPQSSSSTSSTPASSAPSHSSKSRFLPLSFFPRVNSSGSEQTKSEKQQTETDAEAANFEYQRVQRAPPGARFDGEIILRCVTFDQNGQPTRNETKKSVLCRMHGLDPRDLRRIEKSFTPSLVPTILVRKQAILITILHIRALVKADSVLVFDVQGSQYSTLQKDFMHHLSTNLGMKNTGIPYEFRALEAILVSACGALEAESDYTQKIVNELLNHLENTLSRENLRSLLQHSRRLTAFKNRATGVMEAIEEVLENDEDMAAMYLTSNQLTPEPRNEKDHKEVEVLLESIQKQVEGIVNEVENTVQNVQSTQDIVELILDANRNKLLAMDLRVSIGTMGIGTSALLAGLFGMNLQSHLESHPYAFWIVMTGASTLALVITSIGFRRLNRLMNIGLADSGTHVPRFESFDCVRGKPGAAGPALISPPVPPLPPSPMSSLSSPSSPRRSGGKGIHGLI